MLVHRCEELLDGFDSHLLFFELARHYWYYLRPQAVELLHEMLQHFRVAIYTTMSEENLRVILQGLLGMDYEHMLVGVFDRQFLKPDPKGRREWDTMRDIERIWASPQCSGRYDATNTVLFETDMRRVREHYANAIIVPFFDAAALRRGDDGTLGLLRQTLPLVASDFNKMRPMERDVRKLLSLTLPPVMGGCT